MLFDWVIEIIDTQMIMKIFIYTKNDEKVLKARKMNFYLQAWRLCTSLNNKKWEEKSKQKFNTLMWIKNIKKKWRKIFFKINKRVMDCDDRSALTSELDDVTLRKS